MVSYKLNRKYKDRLFRIIFRDERDLLQLYNAINDSNYTNPNELRITTIEDIVYMGMKNDLSFVIGDVMNLYEHQSSFSPNLPLRGLFYFASLYREYIEPIKHRIYTDSPLYIPFPQYIVFYNGKKEEPERQELKLSQLFIQNSKDHISSLECTAIVLNINLGHNRKLMEKCNKLKEYAEFLATIRLYQATGILFEEAVEKSVDECIAKGILSEILRKNRSEVIDVILTEWNEDEFRDFLKEEAWQAGKNEGEIKGTIKACQSFGISKESASKNLQKEYKLSEGDVKKYLDKYWK